MNNNLEFENEDPSPDSIEDNHPRTNYGEGYYVKETLEEAALRFYPKVITDPYNPSEDLLKEERTIFIEGAKWMQERMYSEEEVYNLTLDSLDLGMRIRQNQLSGYSQKSGKELHKEWFELLKKK